MVTAWLPVYTSACHTASRSTEYSVLCIDRFVGRATGRHRKDKGLWRYAEGAWRGLVNWWGSWAPHRGCGLQGRTGGLHVYRRALPRSPPVLGVPLGKACDVITTLTQPAKDRTVKLSGLVEGKGPFELHSFPEAGGMVIFLQGGLDDSCLPHRPHALLLGA